MSSHADRPHAHRIVPARGPEDIGDAATLFRAYAEGLGIDLAYQDFEAELAGLPGKYAPPSGELLLARDASGVAVGCVAVRALAERGVCEMKRLYVAPSARGSGLGRALVGEIVAVARRLGHDEMRLDTIPQLAVAARLYREAGFTPIPPYYDTPVPGTLFLSLHLR